MVFYFYLSVLILILGAQIFLRSFRSERSRIVWISKAKLTFWLVFISQILHSGYNITNQYLIWQSDEATKFLLPPYQPVSYFLFYGLGRIISPLIISIAIAFIFLFLASYLNRRFGERFFYHDEPYLTAIAILIVSHPLLIIYLASILITALLGTIVKKISSKRAVSSQQSAVSSRFSLYYFWIPLAIFSIIIGKIAVVSNWTWFWEVLSSWKIG